MLEAPGEHSRDGIGDDGDTGPAREAGEVFIDGFKAIRSPGDAIDYVKDAFGWTLEKLDGLFPRQVSDAPVPVRRFVTTGFTGDNGVEILSGLAPGEVVVLNP